MSQLKKMLQYNIVKESWNISHLGKQFKKRSFRKVLIPQIQSTHQCFQTNSKFSIMFFQFLGNCESQQSFVDLLTSSVFTWLFVCFHGDLSIYLHRMMFQTIQTIYFLKAYHLVMTMTETNTYKKTKTHIHRQRQIQSASKTQCMLYLSKAGGSRI